MSYRALCALTIRRAVSGDHAAFANLLPELQVDDVVPSIERWEREFVPTTWIAEQNGVVVGYCYTQELSDSGYVRGLVVAPAARGQGIGRALMEQTATHLRGLGAKSWRLNVRANNAAAVGLYESLGLRFVYRTIVVRFQWALVDGLPDDAAPVNIGTPEPASDAAVEKVFGLPRGQVADVRRLGRALVQAVDPNSGEPVGFASFNPNPPGALPLRVKRLMLARRMLQAVRQYALAGNDGAHIVVEDDRGLADLLVQAGGQVRDEVLNLEGQI